MNTGDTHTRPITIPVSISTSGDNVMVTGLPNKMIYVHQILLIAEGNVEVKVQKSATPSNIDISIVPLLANQGVVLENTKSGAPFLFDLNQNVNLILNLSGAVSVKGHITYSTRN